MRKLEDWIESYMEYTFNTESARIYHRWTGLSVIAACLRKKVRLSIGRMSVYPNMYVLLVGPPGGPRKSEAIASGVKILNEIPDIRISADAITPEALIQDLESSTVDEPLPDGSTFQHASITVTSREFESFIGQKGENKKMIITLTDLFDAQELPWKYRTKHYGDNVIPSVFLNIIAATTPESISESLPSTAMGSGLGSRIAFIWAAKRAKKVTYPTDHEVKHIKEDLIHDLHRISRMAGTYEYDIQAHKFWDDWYNAYEPQDTKRICKDYLFNGWYERKPLYLQKLTLLFAASEGDQQQLSIKQINKAIETVEEAEKHMSNVFKAAGRSIIATDVDEVCDIIKERKWITEKNLLSITWKNMDSSKFDNVITTCIRRGYVKRIYKGPKGEVGDVWYAYAGEEKEI